MDTILTDWATVKIKVDAEHHLYYCPHFISTFPIFVTGADGYIYKTSLPRSTIIDSDSLVAENLEQLRSDLEDFETNFKPTAIEIDSIS